MELYAILKDSLDTYNMVQRYASTYYPAQTEMDKLQSIISAFLSRCSFSEKSFNDYAFSTEFGDIEHILFNNKMLNLFELSVINSVKNTKSDFTNIKINSTFLIISFDFKLELIKFQKTRDLFKDSNLLIVPFNDLDDFSTEIYLNEFLSTVKYSDDCDTSFESLKHKKIINLLNSLLKIRGIGFNINNIYETYSLDALHIVNEVYNSLTSKYEINK